jgi:hypothetical protein
MGLGVTNLLGSNTKAMAYQASFGVVTETVCTVVSPSSPQVQGHFLGSSWIPTRIFPTVQL